jgi:hypothetical protein
VPAEVFSKFFDPVDRCIFFRHAASG